ncbi:heparanase-like [Megachile rotundata]|uniref:heparanase-like n=1 Tax=Megachile rotundata TaxID=143995 RepID=UPI003FD1A9B3
MSYFILDNQSKNQYEKFNEIRIQSVLHPNLRLTLLGFCIIFLILSVWNLNNMTNPTVNTYIFNLNATRLHVVSDKFLSFGLDTSLLRDMEDLPITNEKFINLAHHLSPAYVRVGGTSADCLHFNKTVEISSKKVISAVDGQDISNFTINKIHFENLYNFAIKSNLRMIFDLNVLIRNANGSWDNTNAKSIISFAKEKNMKLDWQLGNEPNSFYHVFNRTVTAIQLANDYYQLRNLLNEAGYNESLLVGPEVNHVGDTNHVGEHYAEIFLENDQNSVNYVTWHQYYLNGREAKVTDFINISVFNYLPQQIKSIKKAIQLSGKNISMWLSETSTAYGGGAPNLSDRFVAGFLWLDKLGYSASANLNVVTRQSLFGGNYAMIGPDLIPNPDWWVSVIYKQFVSEKVLEISTANNSDHVRLYAHCTPEKALINKVPAVTIYGINIAEIPVHIIIQEVPVLHKDAKVYLYALTSVYLQSRAIKLNGKILRLQPNGNLPSFEPVILNFTQPILLPSYSMVFIVIHDTKIPACKV